MRMVERALGGNGERIGKSTRVRLGLKNRATYSGINASRDRFITNETGEEEKKQ